MTILAAIRRIFDALVTATAVVLGLAPDPSAVPVEHDRQSLR